MSGQVRRQTRSRADIRKRVFVSYASPDKELAGAFVNLLQAGAGLGGDEVFWTSPEGFRVPAGEDLVSYIRKELVKTPLVVQLISPAFYESPFCLSELGAQWALAKESFPILVPPVTYEDLRAVLVGREARIINKSADLDDLYGRICKTLAKTPHIARWNAKRDEFLQTIRPILEQITFSPKIEVKEFNRIVNELGAFRHALERLTRRDYTKYKESIERTWFVDANGDDRTILRYRTSVEASEVLFWRRIDLSSNEATAPGAEEMQLSVSSKSHNLDALRVIDQPHRLSYVVFFDPPVRTTGEGGMADWIFDYHWPGFWNPLRRSGEDFGRFELTKPGDRALVRMIFPREWKEIIRKARVMISPPDTGKMQRDLDARTGPTLRWEIRNPDAGEYRIDIRLTGKLPVSGGRG